MLVINPKKDATFTEVIVVYSFYFFPIIIHVLPGGLVVRIRRSHRRGRGLIPRLGKCFAFANPRV